MQYKLILVFSLLFIALGFTIPADWLAMTYGENGELFIPVSSGSEDPFIIKLALASYVLSFLYVGMSIKLRRGIRFITPVYILNCIFYLLCMFLVSLDSSVLEAAKYGNRLPISQLVLWLISVVAIGWATFNKSMQPTANASAD